MNSLSGIEPKGLVHLYSGDGKGKTTAAAGLCVRALGAKKAVLFCQFLKGSKSCELEGLKSLGAKIIRAKCGNKFVYQMDEAELAQLKKDHEACFLEISELILSGDYGLVVLDEAVDAVNRGLIDAGTLINLINSRPAHVEIVITGHKPGEEIKNIADYETDFVCIKHPFEQGVGARRGIEF